MTSRIRLRCRMDSRRGRRRSLSASAWSSGRVPRSRSPSRSCFATRLPGGASRRWVRTREPRGWPVCTSGRTSCSRTRRRESSTQLLRSSWPASASTSIPPSAPPICLRRSPPSSLRVRRLSGGLASATSTWVAALALVFLTQMLLILGLSTAMQFIVFGASIIVGMLISGDRVATLLGRLLRPVEARPPIPSE